MSVFKEKIFQRNLWSNHQYISFSCVGSHHQNGKSERYIRTLIERERTILVHSIMHWDKGLDT